MSLLGQLALLIAFVGFGYAGFAFVTGRKRSGDAAAAAGLAALTVVLGVLAWALLVKDFRFAYVAAYSSRQLPWHYSLSALWVGQAGSLLVWAWLAGLLAVGYRVSARRRFEPSQRYASAALTVYVCFLVGVMLFGADPMKQSVAGGGNGAGLSPLLQHPAMLIHPPVVLLGYAAWAVPFALAVGALAEGRPDAGWARQTRPWALFAWISLGAGILLGGLWAYQELGWGGYWAWDPVENGSLIPWLAGTAMIHTLLAWQHRGAWKKTALGLAVVTFAMCNFATFLTRSGIFSSLHAFSQSPIGWMFLALVFVLAAAGGMLVFLRRKELRPEQPIATVWSREAAVLMLGVALGLLAAVAWAGSLSLPLSSLLFGKRAMVGTAFYGPSQKICHTKKQAILTRRASEGRDCRCFSCHVPRSRFGLVWLIFCDGPYNSVLVPTGLVALVVTAAAPLLRWGKPPDAGQKKAIAVSAAGCLVLDAAGQRTATLPRAVLGALGRKRRTYAGFLIHLGFVCLAVGVTGSSLGTRRHEAVMREGETVEWAGRSLRLVRLHQRRTSDKLIAEAQLEIRHAARPPVTLLPARHLHLPHDAWTTEVAIHSTWGGDFYTIARAGEGPGRAHLTFVLNPLMRWIWLGGWVIAAGALAGLWPVRRRWTPPVPSAKFAAHARRRRRAANPLSN